MKGVEAIGNEKGGKEWRIGEIREEGRIRRGEDKKL